MKHSLNARYIQTGGDQVITPANIAFLFFLSSFAYLWFKIRASKLYEPDRTEVIKRFRKIGVR